ncbi:MAG: acetyl-CoA carboxylase carboxyltransferase subunit alpha [Opitutales bacterium]|nr:acetyl-CoA carboxylase carboxyltransferase subunit alpha [Opitutales bacterium]
MSSSEFILDFEKPIRTLEEQIESLGKTSNSSKVDVEDELGAIRKKLEDTQREVYSHLTPWQRVQIARHPQRPTTLDYVERIFTDFQELHGDRSFKDDQALIGGPAFFEGSPVMVIGHQKGRNTKENLARNFGCPHPEGYRKALRLMKQAEKFGLPIVTLIDTPGAYPGIGAEERHVAEAIALNIREMSSLTVPIVSVIIGEGGSGGALGIAVANQVSIFENAYYSVISPEGCAAILWKDRAAAAEAASALKLGAQELIKFDIVDAILDEPIGGAHRDWDFSATQLKKQVKKDLKSMQRWGREHLQNQRYERFRNFGTFVENAPKKDPSSEA